MQTFVSVKQKELQQQKQEVFVLDDHQVRCQKDFMKYINVGKMEKSLEPRQLRHVICLYQHSDIERRFTKKPNCCKWAILQKCVTIWE